MLCDSLLFYFQTDCQLRVLQLKFSFWALALIPRFIVFFSLCCLFVWWCVSSLSFVPFIHLCSYARVYKPCTQFQTASSSTTSCPCLCIHIYSNHLHTYTNNELRSVFLSLSAFLSFTLFHPILKVHSMLTTKLSRPNAIVLLSLNK